MRTVKKEVKLELTEEQETNFLGDYTQELTFSSKEHISKHKLSHYVEVEVPETIKEFRELHNISKEDLVEWLNENYKG